MGCGGDRDLKLLSCLLALKLEGLLFLNILLEVIENLQFIIQGNQGVQLVLQLDIFLLEKQLQARNVALFKHRLCKGWLLL